MVINEFASLYESVELSSALPTFSSCFNLRTLSEAADKCRKGTSWKEQVQKFMVNKNMNCHILLHEILDQSYQLSSTFNFRIYERGKIRNVKSIHIRDRVVQRCLCDQVYVPIIKDLIVRENSACLKNRGLDYAIRNLRYDVSKIPDSAWLVKFDFKNYFESIKIEYVLAMLSFLVKDPDIYNVFRVILKSNHGGKDDQQLELGSHVSQLSGVLFLDIIDKKIKEFPGVLAYSRYMDDGLIFCDGRQTAKDSLSWLKEYVQVFDLTINDEKSFINRVTQPFIFCKRRIKKRGSRVNVNVRKESTRRSLRHLRHLLFSSKPIDLDPPFNSTIGYINSGDEEFDLMELLYDLKDLY